MEREGRIAVAAGEERDVMSRLDQSPDERVAMRLHSAHERGGDGVADMRDDGDPQRAGDRGGLHPVRTASLA
ncbi:hypothetical protein GCM10022281_12140 [Sphingomonas rosea]|uniref:Uncharacterized protein n=1 Tax=Sphingomonas rosea TaxID=335605 RepID=A0ABP7U039_9SPHN